MSEYKLTICDMCGDEQRSDRLPHWELLHVSCSWRVPKDGINGGRFSGMLCAPCRVSVLKALDRVSAERMEELR